MNDYVNKKDLEGLVTEVARSRISRRQFMERALAMGLSIGSVGAVLAACGEEQTPTSASQSAPSYPVTKPTTIHVYNWAYYLDPKSKKNFQKETGIKIEESYFDSSEDLLTKLKAGARGYDVIVPGDYMVHVMIKTGLLLPLDMKLIPNFKNCNPGLTDPVYDKKSENGGLKYSVPYQWGSTGISVRTDKVNEEVTGWETLWDPKYKGQINMDKEPTELFAAALKLLGYSLNSTSKTEIDEATQKLIEQKPLVSVYDANNMKRFIVQGVPLVHAFSGDTLLAMQAVGADKVSFVLPSQGFSFWTDCLCIPKGAPSPYAAHQYMDFFFDPQNAANLVDYTWYYSPVPAAYDVLGPDSLLTKSVPSAEDLARGEQKTDLGEIETYYREQYRVVMTS
jgi:spermidine/putrescine transport system substrate-binding protein